MKIVVNQQCKTCKIYNHVFIVNSRKSRLISKGAFLFIFRGFLNCEALITDEDVAFSINIS